MRIIYGADPAGQMLRGLPSTVSPYLSLSLTYSPSLSLSLIFSLSLSLSLSYSLSLSHSLSRPLILSHILSLILSLILLLNGERATTRACVCVNVQRRVYLWIIDWLIGRYHDCLCVID